MGGGGGRRWEDAGHGRHGNGALRVATGGGRNQWQGSDSCAPSSVLVFT